MGRCVLADVDQEARCFGFVAGVTSVLQYLTLDVDSCSGVREQPGSGNLLLVVDIGRIASQRISGPPNGNVQNLDNISWQGCMLGLYIN